MAYIADDNILNSTARTKEQKLQQYEDFLENRLKVDLKDIEELLKEKHKSYTEWEELKQTIRIFKGLTDRDINLQVPIGCGVYVNAETSEYDRILVNIGLGCHLELDYEEADKYADIRMKAMQREINHFRSLAAKVKANIKVVLLGMNELREGNFKKRT